MTGSAARPRRGRGRPPGSDGAQTRDAILRAARELFSEVGYDRATLSGIATRAGVTRTNINHYFRSKDKLYRTLFEADKDNVITAGIADAGAASDLADRMAAFLRITMRGDSENRTYVRFLAVSLFDALRNPELADWAEEQIDNVRGFIRPALEAAAADGTIGPDVDIATATEVLIAVVWGMSMYAGFVGAEDRLEPMIDQLTALLRGVLW
ncbi:TetR/AcrR family transcriptional regulator [Nocardia speluncae]|uniref:TetR/AcrR family transcriptional regulator n=1 Tax=Nocardia speluncae TaxID=419477 RepID=A0A846X7J6_9NOCA|nr:TetR/AcrR family transcriptional regulator [Nocardia speluncae]NKY31467.1 TetR/AcrR family transcriptional regulator [Nocardia speluncae]